MSPGSVLPSSALCRHNAPGCNSTAEQNRAEYRSFGLRTGDCRPPERHDGLLSTIGLCRRAPRADRDGDVERSRTRPRSRSAVRLARWVYIDESTCVHITSRHRSACCTRRLKLIARSRARALQLRATRDGRSYGAGAGHAYGAAAAAPVPVHRYIYRTSLIGSDNATFWGFRLAEPQECACSRSAAVHDNSQNAVVAIVSCNVIMLAQHRALPVPSRVATVRP